MGRLGCVAGNWWPVSVAAVCDRRGQPISLGGASSVRTEISDFIAAKRRGNYGKIMDSKMIGGETERLLTSQVEELQIAKAMKILIKRNDATLFELSQCR